MLFVIALALALDQRIEWQAPLVLIVAAYAWWRVPGTRRPLRPALALLAVVAGYLLLNSLVGLIDPVGLAENWWAAPLRVGLFFLLLLALTVAVGAPRVDAEAIFRALEWLLLLKFAIAGFELTLLLTTGELRERPLFNIILSTDSLLGVRMTSSYDLLFSLFALATRRSLMRISLLALVLLLTETRALLLLTLLFLGWRIARGQAATLLIAIVAAAILSIGVQLAGSAGVATADGDGGSRLTRIAGSSVDDKLEQIEAVLPLLASPAIVTGRGLGMSMPGLVRDEARPYSYEAQTVVLLWQGGLLFFGVYVAALWVCGGHGRALAIAIVLGLGLLNPMLFSLASAFMVLALDKLLRAQPAAA